MRRAYAAYCLAVLALYGLASWNGWEISSSKRGFVPAGVRQAPGGYRSYNYWRGGK
jgi:hypothetical protein